MESTFEDVVCDMVAIFSGLDILIKVFGTNDNF